MNKKMKTEIKLSVENIVDAIQGNDFEPSETDIIERIDYLNGFLEYRRKYLEDKYMGCEEEYAIGDVINLINIVKNKFK
tara:strand:+ start:304 stop:540 length:237 start_codon:yes stop_codon:yes gene_type:complete